MKQILSILLFFILSVNMGFAQHTEFINQLEGYWLGTYIRGNSAQVFEVEFFQEDDTLRSSLSIPDWQYYSPLIAPVTIKEDVISIESYYGEMKLLKDSAYAEMIGECDFASVHMKKGLRPRKIILDTIPLSFAMGDIQLNGKMVREKGSDLLPAAIMVHGRGCASMESWNQQAEVLARYGLAVIEFDKRGSENTGFPCEQTNMKNHALDLAKITDQLISRRDISQVGFISSSAGGWVAPMAAQMTSNEVAFITTVVGPSTSVKQQQLDCSEYFLREYFGLGEMEISEAQELVEWEFSNADPNLVFSKIMALVDSAKAHGWYDVLEDSDIPKSPEQLDELWVRRNNYDPADDLMAYDGPFLSILGGSDYVVPYQENAARLNELFSQVGKKNYRIAILPSANHGMEHGHKLVDLKRNKSLNKWYTYWKFDRVAAGTLDEIIRFLRAYNIIDK